MRKAIIGGLLAAGLAVGGAVATPPAPAEAASKPCTSYVYGYGGYSVCIGYIQRMIGADIGTKVDNSFGPDTLWSVKEFQKWKGLKADGWVGPNTWSKLCSTYRNNWISGVRAAARSAGC